jgi:hypothetical protein
MSKENLAYLQDAKAHGVYGPEPDKVRPGDLYLERGDGVTRFFVVLSVQYMTFRDDTNDRIVSVFVFEGNEFVEHTRFWVRDLIAKMRA